MPASANEPSVHRKLRPLKRSVEKDNERASLLGSLTKVLILHFEKVDKHKREMLVEGQHLLGSTTYSVDDDSLTYDSDGNVIKRFVSAETSFYISLRHRNYGTEGRSTQKENKQAAHSGSLVSVVCKSFTLLIAVLLRHMARLPTHCNRCHQFSSARSWFTRHVNCIRHNDEHFPRLPHE